MTVHHHMAVMMSEVCVERSSELRESLVELCRGIVDAQMREISMMQSWLGEWYGITDFDPHALMDPAMMEMHDRMRAMPAAAFERMFLEEMIVHHAAALQPARQCRGKAAHQELKSLCADIVRVQVAEIATMRQWLCEWFGVCHYHVDPHRRRSAHG